MKILLVAPPLCDEPLEMEAKESIGLGYLAAVLRERGFEVGLLDADLLHLDNPQTVREITREPRDLVGFSLLEGTIESAAAIIRGVRAASAGVHIVLGGYFPTLVTEDLLQELPEADSIIRGEGEFALPFLADALEKGRDWRDIPGIAWRDGGAPIVNGQGRAPDLDSLPFPSRELLPEVLSRGGCAGLVGSRGCFSNCSFCCINAFAKASGAPSWRGRSPVRIVDEMESLAGGHGVRTVSFYDSNFIGPGAAGQARAGAIAEEILKRGLKINFAISTRPDQVDPDLFGLLKSAGLTEVFIGLESMSQKSLDFYNKRTSVEQNRRAVEVLERLGIHFRPGFILYEPYITLAQIRENVDFLRELIESRYCNKFHFFKALRIYRGSPLEGALTRAGILRRQGWHNLYLWQDPAVARFIYLTGLLAPKMLPLMARDRGLGPSARREVDRLLGKWAIALYDDVLDLIDAGPEKPSQWMNVVLRADEGLARVERAMELLAS